MAEPEFLEMPNGRRIAYRQTAGMGPTLVFLGGLMSDMEGTKALHLEAWCESQGRGFLRFDYSGHGQSSGAFTDFSIGDWAEDAEAILAAKTEGPLLLIGSSMGGWVSLLMTKRIPNRIAGLVTIAAAPDFTEDSMWDGFSDAQKSELEDKGVVNLPSDYGEPYPISKHLIGDSRNHLVLRDPLDLPCPTRFLQGTADRDVEMSVALRLLEHATGPDMRLVLLKDADHRFSDEAGLKLLVDAVNNVLGAIV